MPPSRRLPSPDVAALRVATEGIVRQLGTQARKQARLIRTGAAGELTEADVERMAASIAAAARARLEACVPYLQSPSADRELQATRREANQLIAVAAREVDAELRNAWRTWQEKAGGRWRRR
jgi:hypothetical protein